jgi:outer membrane lipoprotein-sorting protein
MTVNSRTTLALLVGSAIGIAALGFVATPRMRAASLPDVGADQTKPASSKTPDLFTEIYNRSVAQKKTMTSIRAKFTETTESSLLTRPIVAHGTVVATSSARVLMTYTDPERKTITMDGKRLTIAWPDRNEREQINIADVQKRIEHYFAEATIGDLRSMFEIGARPDSSAPHLDRIDMRPKRKQIQQGLELLELWIDRQSVQLSRMRLSFPGGDRKTIALEDVVLNVPVSEEMFQAR